MSTNENSQKSRHSTFHLIVISAIIVSALTLTVGLTPSAFPSKESSEPRAELLYTIEAGNQKYVIHFNVCAGDKNIEKPKILIISDLGTTEVTSFKTIYANSCQSYEANIKAKYPNMINLIVEN